MGLVIAVVILAALTAAGVTVYIKVRRLSESLLGTSDVTEGINRIRENVSTTPKSVSGSVLNGKSSLCDFNLQKSSPLKGTRLFVIYLLLHL